MDNDLFKKLIQGIKEIGKIKRGEKPLSRITFSDADKKVVSMENFITYKGYYGSVHFDAKNNVFYGKIEVIRALVTYEALSLANLEKAFHDAVNIYLETCTKNKIHPEKSI